MKSSSSSNKCRARRRISMDFCTVVANSSVVVCRSGTCRPAQGELYVFGLQISDCVAILLAR